MDPLRKGIAIGMLFGSEGRTATNLIESKTINENGTYSAVYEIDPETGEVYDPPKDGYETVVVSLPIYNKRVALTTSDVTDSQTAIFEYDPQDETPTPWEGYLYFTIDLSGVKRDINDLLDQISALEDQLEEMQECCEDVAEILDATPEEGESCCDAVKSKAQEAVDHIEECDQCKDTVIAAIQQYVPSFTPDPTTCNIPDGVDDVYQQGKDDEATENPPGYTLPVGTDPSDPNIQTIVAGNPLTDNTTGVTLGFETYKNPDNSWGAGPYIIVDGIKTNYWYVTGGTAVPVDHFSDIGVWVTDPTTGDWSATVTVHWGIAWSPTVYTGRGSNANLIGYGNPSSTYTVKNN